MIVTRFALVVTVMCAATLLGSGWSVATPVATTGNLAFTGHLDITDGVGVLSAGLTRQVDGETEQGLDLVMLGGAAGLFLAIVVAITLLRRWR